MISRIVPSGAEHIAGALESGTIEHASQSFRRDGALIIEDIMNTTLIAEAQREFTNSYSQHLNGDKYEHRFVAGDRRWLITVDLAPPFDNPQLFANPYLLPVLRLALGDGFVIGEYGVSCSLPSATAQHIHHDSPILFPGSSVDWLLPAWAILVSNPLIEINEIHGTTALWLGTHRDANRSHAARDSTRNADLGDGRIEPVVRVGSCMLWDYRLVHSGTANRSAMPRPLLCVTYCRPWFWEYANFKAEKNPKHEPLLVKAEVLSALPAEQQRLLARAQTR
jgi:ectoine hydroxylase-related dioxygenase (phytanoyl-CoA dioxygenase family)